MFQVEEGQKAIMYRIKDASNALLKVQDYDRSLQTLSLGIVSQHINQHDSPLDVETIVLTVQKGIKEHARGWGLEIMRVYMTDIELRRI